MMSVLTLVANTVTWAQAPPEPRAVLELYATLDSGGKQLTLRGWLQLARMFIPEREPHPGPMKLNFDKIEVIRGFTIDDPVVEGADAARFTVRYSLLGKIDYDSLAFSPTDGKSPKESVDTFKLVFTTRHFGVDSDGASVLLTGRRSWRIEGFPHTPRITAEAAISQIVKWRNGEARAEVRANADKTISALNALR